jgi:prepilin-type N-terminal cleavage/methylation domain-containing protein
MKPFKSVKKLQSGFTLVELGIVVAIAAVIIGLGLVVVPSILASVRANSEVSDLPTIATKVQKTFANVPNYSTLTQAIAVGMRVFPDATVAGVTVTNRWGGAVTIAPSTIVLANDAFTLTSVGVPAAECVQIAQGMERNARIISIAGVVVKPDGGGLDLAKVGTQCGLATTSTMVYTFGK